MDQETSRGISDRLSDIRLLFPELKEVGGVFMNNYENAYQDMVGALRRIDGDIREEIVLSVYKDKLSYETLSSIDYFNDLLTDYGEHILEIRFCCGYFGNLAKGDRVVKDECIAMIYAYECYWHEGDDFLLGIVVENLLRRIESPEKWNWPPEAEFKRSQKNRQIQWLAHTVGKEMKALASFHRLSQPGMGAFATAVPVKPLSCMIWANR